MKNIRHHQTITLLLLLFIGTTDGAFAAGDMNATAGSSSKSFYKRASAQPVLQTQFVLHLKASADGNAVNDVAAEACISVSGSISYSGVSISAAWGKTFSLGAPGNPITLDLNLVNNCQNDKTEYLATWDTGQASVWVGDWVTVPVAKTCSASVQDVGFGEVYEGATATSSLSITKSGTGSGTVKVSGNDLTSTGDLYLGGDENLIVHPSDSSYIGQDSGKGIWVSDASQKTIPLEIQVGNNAKTGEHKSVLTATLTCE
ncbi:hypothetical protein SAMN05192562_1211 [Kosakonia arachidis]|uniref:Pilin (Type 1 fimbria component protein) n=1 Tax=Kosakonia arachidis TaxID=551989 RepID=A0A1I7EC65_9ENTR|nr:hypothetical protein [Kosakonia arachidis]SFU21556.1 hypothetical protein SAMN05192562_1211 [Kosakonia arachidis]